MFKWFGKINFSHCTKVWEFANYLKDGRLMGSKCKKCGMESFPPRADCNACLSADFEYIEFSGRATLVSFSKINAAPTGFENMAPYTIGVVDLEETGRLLAWFGETVPEKDIDIGMKLQIVPRVFEELEEIKVYYTLEKPGTSR